MDLVLFTSSKKKAECAGMDAAVKSVAGKFKGELHVGVLDLENRANRLTAVQFKVSSPPALVLDGELIFKGRQPTAAELEKFITERLEESRKAKKSGRRYWSISGLPENWGAER